MTKFYSVMQNIGKSKYVVSYCDGQKTYKEAQRECEAHVMYHLFKSAGQTKEILKKQVKEWSGVADADKQKLIKIIDDYPVSYRREDVVSAEFNNPNHPNKI
jgi:hypothetical protein